MNVATLCIAVLGALVVGGGFGVSMQRRKAIVSIGAPEDPAHPLTRWMRAHGNTIEYAPMLAILIFLTSQPGAPIWVVACAIGATISRVLIAAGLALGATLARPNPGRFFGALGTYIFGIGLVVALLLQSM